jgi:hypothetical protein
MVGAAISEVPHDRWYWSNYGSRIDCYAWGENIVTTGYGDLYRGTDDNSAYTNTFGGTSGAAAIIAGTALIVQGKRQATTGRLSPAQMRDVLSNPAAGTAQGGNVAGHIGVMPDLSLIV